MNSGNQDALAFTSRKVITMADGTLRLSIDFEPADAQAAFNMFGQPGVAGAVVRLTEDAAKSQMQQKSIASAGDYGHSAKYLRQQGFFRSPQVWPHIGADEFFLSWLRKQKCAKTGSCGSEDDPVVAAHVRRVANGAGTGIKPPYSAIPLLNSVHQQQHQHGESSVAPKEWWDEKRIEYLERWSWETLKAKLGYESWSRVPPSVLGAWSAERGLHYLLPSVYRTA